MAHATCLNNDCDKGTWRLTKPVSSYKGGVSCPSCGTTRTEIEFEDGEQQDQTQTAARQSGGGRQQGGQQRGGQAPARQQQSAQQGGAPAVAGEPESAGDAIAQSALALTSDEATTGQQAEAFKGIGSVLLDGATRFAKYKEQLSTQQEEHAKNTQLQEVEDKPKCECGYVFSKIPQSKSRIACPECGREFRVIEEE